MLATSDQQRAIPAQQRLKSEMHSRRQFPTIARCH